MYKIIFLCTLVVLISGKPTDVVPVAVSSVNEPKAEIVPVEVRPDAAVQAVEPLLKTSESESTNEEAANQEQLRGIEDADNIAARPLWLINRLRSTTTAATTMMMTSPTTMAGGMTTAGGMTMAPTEMTMAPTEMTMAPTEMTMAPTTA